MKKIHICLFLAALSIFTACTREAADLNTPSVSKPCQYQTVNPNGRAYSSDSIVAYPCTDKHCGIMPLSAGNYWIYIDSMYTDGALSQVKYDTLRYTETYKSLSDGLIWWKGSKSIGIPDMVYANDSAFFDLQDRLFTLNVKDVKKDYTLCAGDSLKYLSSFDDMAAIAKTVHYKNMVSTPAGLYDNCIYFEKNAPRVRKDQIYFKEGLGVLRYVIEEAAPGSAQVKLQQISTLVRFHID